MREDLIERLRKSAAHLRSTSRGGLEYEARLQEEAAAALEAAREDARVNAAMVERALSHKAFREDGAEWPDAYSEDEQRIERDAMAALLAAALRCGGPAAYCRACQRAGMSNCAHFDECSGATCITCHQPLNQAIDQARGKGCGAGKGEG